MRRGWAALRKRRELLGVALRSPPPSRSPKEAPAERLENSGAAAAEDLCRGRITSLAAGVERQRVTPRASAGPS